MSVIQALAMLTKTMQLKSLVALLLLVISHNSHGIIIRHDVAPERYLASLDEFPALATFYVDGAHGVLISPRWLLTAAHTTFCLEHGIRIAVGEQRVAVKQLYIHPGHTPGVSHDIALVELQSPITDIKPAKLFQEKSETGLIATLIGRGGTGNGKTGITTDNYANKGVLRKAQNQVDRADGPLLWFRFDSGDQALELEGISGGGDSGGPAFITRDDDFWLLGVSSRYGGGPSEKYQSREVYSRVSYFVPWINKVMNPAESTTRAHSLAKLKHYMPGLNAETLPEICQQIRLQ